MRRGLSQVMAKRGNLFVVSGPSGVGKGSICALLSQRRKDIKLSVSCATRAIRPNEIDGVHYFFVSNERFDQMIESDELLEHADVHGNRYGTPRKWVLDTLEQGCDVILEIDVQGGKQVLARDVELIGVFVLPPSKDELIKRLKARGTETQQQVDIRVHNAARELKEAESYPYLIVNDDLQGAVKKLEAIIDASHETIAQQSELLQSLYHQFQEGQKP